MRKLLVLMILALLCSDGVRAETMQTASLAPVIKYSGEPASVLATMDSELHRSLSRLKNAGKAPVYYLAYRLYEGNFVSIVASNGALREFEQDSNWRMLSVDLRVGSRHFDNTHPLRDEDSDSPTFWDRASKLKSILPECGGGLPLQQCLWITTDEAYKSAQQRYSDLTVSHAVMSAEDDSSDDFSFQPVHNYQPQLKSPALDLSEWTGRVRRLSQLFSKHPGFTSSEVSLTANPTTRYMVNSEGSKIVEQHFNYCISIEAAALAKDGMRLSLTDSVNVLDPTLLPDEVSLAKRVDKLAQSLEQLRQAPVAEPYVGPAILSGRAAAVFFHETLGHRVEALHQKNESEGKTFSHRIGSTVMPYFLTVLDDPTVAKVGGEYLNGHYLYDDEGVVAQPVTIARKGVLTSFLLSRTLVRGFKASNGHGRCSPGWNPVARQGNLFVKADKSKQVSPEGLRALLIKEAKRQHKSYGLLFDEITGGSTCTSSDSNQTYIVHPLKVYKVFVDGRPDLLIRGAEIVGTPLAALERVLAAGNDTRVFNGMCGRDSGLIPVSAVAPSLLVQSIETKRAARSTERMPILSDPTIKKVEPALTRESDKQR